MKDEGASASAVSRGNRRGGGKRSVGAAIKDAGSKPPPKPRRPRPGARATGATIKQTGGKKLPQIFKPGGGSGRPSPSSSPKGGRNVFTTRPPRSSFTTQRAAARDAVRDARTDAVRSGRMRGLGLPVRPVLEGGYTDDQRSSIIRDTEEAISDAVKTRGSAREKLSLVNALDESDGPSELRRLGDEDARRALNKYIGATDTRKAQVVDEVAGRDAPQSREGKIGLFETAERKTIDAASEANPGRPKTEVKAMGLNIPIETGIKAAVDRVASGHGAGLRGPANLAWIVPTQTARTLEDPKKAAEVNAKFVGQTALGLVTTPAKMVYDVATGKPVADVAKDTGQAMADEYAQFYGPAWRGDAGGFYKNVSESGGAARVGLDALTLAAPAGKLLGTGAKAGVLGPRAERLVTSPRANLRYSLGDDAVKVQRSESDKAMPNLFRAAAQRGMDEARRRSEEGRVRRSRDMVRRAGEGESTTRDRMAAMFGGGTMPVVRARGGTRYVGERGPGEVTSLFRVTEQRMQRRNVAKRKNQSVDEIRETAGHLDKAADDALGKLSKAEREAWGFLHRDLVGTSASGADVVAQLQRRRQQIVENRRGQGHTPGLLAADEIKIIDRLLEDPDAAFTDRAAQAAKLTRALQRKAEDVDPDLPRERADNRRFAQLASVLGVERGGLTKPELRTLRTAVHADARKELADARKAYEQALVKSGVAQGRAEVLSRNVGGVAAEKLAERAGNPRARKDGSYAGGEIGASAAKGAMDEAKARLEAAVAAERAARESRSKKRIDDDIAKGRETDADFHYRVRQAAQAEGLAGDPGYIPSRPRFSARLSDYAPGGARATAGHRKYSGELFDLGIEQISPEVFKQGLRRNVKLNVNWRLVSDQIADHAHPKLRDMPVGKLMDKAHGMNLDEREWGVWMPGRMRKQDGRGVAEAGRDIDPDVPEGLRQGMKEATAGAKQTLDRDAVMSLADLRRMLDAGEISGDVRATVVAKGALNEIMSSTRPQGAAMRGANIARSKASRVLFAFNPVWFAANTVGAALPSVMRGVSPKAFIDAQLYFRDLHKRDPAAHTALRRELGIGHQRLQDVQQPRMGGAADNVPGFGGMVRAWQAYRNTPMGRKARPLSASIDAWLKLEQKVNSDAFRRALFHTEARREALRRIDAEAGAANAAMERLTAVVKPGGSSKTLKAKIDEVVAERRTVETLGQKTSNILGDWQTFTAAERNAMGLIFLYPYLRYSLKFLFATMPVHHPVMLNVLAQMAQLNATEVHELLHGEELPYQMGKVYIDEGNGEVKEIEVGKVNPGGNVITEAKDWRMAFGLLPPWFQMAFEQTVDYNIFAGREWRYEGFPDKSKDKPELGMFDETRGRIILRDLLEMFPPTREWSRQSLKGFQGDDSLPWDPRPTVYKSDELKKIAAQMKREQSEGGFWGQFVRHQAFLLPKTSRDPDAAKHRAEEKKPAKPKAKAAGWGSGGGWGGSGGW